MSLNTVFLVFFDFDYFRNVGVTHKGYIFFQILHICSIYKYRVQLVSDFPNQILYCDSNPCTKCNVVNNTYVGKCC